VLEKKSNIVFFYNIFNAILRFSLIVLSVLFFRALYKLLMALVIFQLLRSLVLFIYLKKQYSISSRYIKFSSVSEILRYSLPLGMGNAIGNMGRNIENYVITYLLSPEKFAIYAIANFRIPYLHMVYDSISSVALLKISELQRNNDLNNIIRIWHRIMIQIACIIIPSVILFYILAEPIIIFLFSEQYLQSIQIFRILLINTFGSIIAPAVILRSFNYTGYMFKVDICTFIVGIVISYILTLHFSLMGAAISSLICTYLMISLQSIKAIKILKLPLRKALPYKGLISIMFLSALIGIIPLILNQLNIVYIFKLVFGSTIYFSVILYVFDRLGYLEIINILKRIKSKIIKIK